MQEPGNMPIGNVKQMHVFASRLHHPSSIFICARYSTGHCCVAGRGQSQSLRRCYLSCAKRKKEKKKAPKTELGQASCLVLFYSPCTDYIHRNIATISAARLAPRSSYLLFVSKGSRTVQLVRRTPLYEKKKMRKKNELNLCN